MSKLREEASAILGAYIPEKSWNAVFSRVEISGGLTQKKLWQLMILCLKLLETWEELKETPPDALKRTETKKTTLQSSKK